MKGLLRRHLVPVATGAAIAVLVAGSTGMLGATLPAGPCETAGPSPWCPPARTTPAAVRAAVPVVDVAAAAQEPGAELDPGSEDPGAAAVEPGPGSSSTTAGPSSVPDLDPAAGDAATPVRAPWSGRPMLAAVILGGTGGSSTLAVDDFTVSGPDGERLLGDDFGTHTGFDAVEYGTGARPSFVADDARVTTRPTLAGYGVPAGAWFSPRGDGFSAARVAAGELRAPAQGLAVLAWDLATDDFETSFTLTSPPSAAGDHSEFAQLAVSDPVTRTAEALVVVDDEGAHLRAGHLGLDDYAATAPGVPVRVGERLSLRRSGTTYTMLRDGVALDSFDTTEVGVVTGRVTGVADPTRCWVSTVPASDQGGNIDRRTLSNVRPRTDGRFTFTALSSRPVRVRASCGGTAPAYGWLGGGDDGDRSSSVVVAAVGGASSDVGDLVLPGAVPTTTEPAPPVTGRAPGGGEAPPADEDPVRAGDPVDGGPTDGGAPLA